MGCVSSSPSESDPAMAILVTVTHKKSKHQIELTDGMTLAELRYGSLSPAGAAGAHGQRRVRGHG